MPEPGPPDFYIDEAQPHLGGYIRGGDPATYFPDLWRWLVREQGVRSVLDVGCGEGQALDFFASEGCRVLGIDGIDQGRPDVIQHDYATGPLKIAEPYDLVWSCEFVEHVEERYVACFLASFQAATMVLMTHAEPGQPGYHHVNCQPAAYWKGAMAAAGYRYEDALTREARRHALLNDNPINHFARAGLAFLTGRAGS